MTKNIQTKILVLLISVFTLIFTNSCKQKESKPKGQFLEVVQTSFGEEIKDKTNLIFTFNHAMIESDTILHQWIEADFFNITPKVEGRYKWLDVDQLSFSPAVGFENATDYELSFNKSLLKQNKKIKEWVGLKTYYFNTPYLEITGSYAAWAKDDGSTTQPKITAFFNLPVSSETLKDKIKVEIDKKTYPFEIKSNPSSTEHTIILLENPDQTKAENVKLSLGLIDKLSKEESSKFTTLEAADKLKISKIETAAEGISAVIKVYASQKIDVDAIKAHLEIKPKIKYDINPTFYGFDITSEEIQIGSGYKILLKKGLEGSLGGKLKNDYIQQVSFGNITPEIAFDNDKATYLGKMGNKNVSVKIVGIPKVKVSVYKVFENNLLHFLYRGKEYGSYYNYDAEDRYDRYHSYYYYETSDVGQLIHEEEIVTESLGELGISRILKIDFLDKLQDKNGIYVVKVQDADKYYISDSKLISLSDIGIIAKEDKKNLYIFCNSIKTADPKSGTEVKLISSHNQIITAQTVGADGIAKFSKSSFQEGFVPKLVVTKNGSDFNYMNLENSRYMTSRFDVGGSRTEDTNYDLYMYAERSLYRPGETIHLAGIVRDFDWNVIDKMPINIKLKSPEGKEYSSARVQLDAQGMFTSDFAINASSMTGTYLAEAYTGKDIYLGSKTIQVEEFMPDRIKVDLELDKEQFEVGDSITGEIIAMNYFGPPAADNNYESELTINQGYFNPKGYNDYSFRQQEPFRNYQVYDDGKTDKNGKAAINYVIPKTTLNNGILDGRIYTTVYDETGRPVHRAQRFRIQTQEIFVGIGYFDRWVGTKKPLQIPLIALNKNEKPTSQEVEIEVIKYSWHSTLRYDNGRYRYVSEKESISVSKETITISGENTNYYYTPKNSGSYEVFIRVPETTISLSKSFYAYQYNDTHNTSFEVNNEGNIDITFDKESYQPGENATAILKLPFDGKVLVTTERSDVMSYIYLDSKDKVVTYPIKVSDRHVPNTYVTATLIKPHDGSSSLPLTVAHGFASFEVKPDKAKLNLSIAATEKSRSKTKQTITISTEPNTHLTVAVVDEGILAIGNQKTPDPYNHFYMKRALEVFSSDLYPFLFPEITASGGDEASLEAEMANRQNPLQNKRVKLVSFWSDLLKTDGNGKVSFDVDIPQFSGSLRVMAVAAKNEKFGSIDEQITVADPLVISSSIPRFLSMGDEWNMTVNMSNTTDKTIKGKLNVKTTGPLTASNLESISVEIPPNSETEKVIKVKAGYKIDVAKITTTVDALNETFVEETDITIRPAASLVKQYSSGLIKAGDTKNIDFTNQFLASTDQHRVFISKSPLAQFTNDIDELISYPFGCVEQTVSKAFPQLYFEDLVESIYEEGTEYDANEIKRNVQAAIDKIRIMQLSNGGLSYWPNGGSESWWGTIYAAHFLIEAREKGYQVNRKTIDRMLDYLQDRLKKKEKITYYYNGTQKREIVKKEVGYSLYVLALAGKPDYGSMKHYLNDSEELSLDAKYLLACSFILTDDITSARRLMPASFAGEKSVPSFGGSFYSYIRDLAISTNALIEADPNHPQIPGMIKLLSSEMSSKKYLNTQEMSFGFLAMGKYARLTPIGKATATISSDGKTVNTFKGNDIWINYTDTQNPLNIKVEGEGSIFYFVESQGIPSNDKVVEVDNHLKVRREFYTRDKKLITDGKFEQNDLIVVKVTLQSLTGDYIENVAVTDVLPAGLEIENARITEMPDLSWVNTNMNYDFRDIRDDRIHFFTTAGRNVQTFYYLARAVTPGTYQLGPVSADAMYNGEYHSYNGSGKVTVE